MDAIPCDICKQLPVFTPVELNGVIIVYLPSCACAPFRARYNAAGSLRYKLHKLERTKSNKPPRKASLRNVIAKWNCANTEPKPSPATKNVTCRYCGKPDLFWGKHRSYKNYRLYESIVTTPANIKSTIVGSKRVVLQPRLHICKRDNIVEEVVINS